MQAILTAELLDVDWLAQLIEAGYAAPGRRGPKLRPASPAQPWPFAESPDP